MKSFNEYLTRYGLHEKDAEAIINAVSEYLEAKTLVDAAYEVTEILEDLHPKKYQVVYKNEYFSSNCDNFEFFASLQEAEDFVNNLPPYYVWMITKIK